MAPSTEEQIMGGYVRQVPGSLTRPEWSHWAPRCGAFSLGLISIQLQAKRVT